ncbi:membrane protein [Tetragenococcus halophilus subsp. flandriensis]|uniref:DUF3307 domain-containing protein n=1 Tax=Tetragenococcus halophilus TaxID=51669 RepID=UPI0023E9DAB0|nr:DUF3307 domain-containing protein [Tetragenococcus halophilus]GMA08317.1 membrane protein [Tetragenococcus halophilus subsp. flandriensis]
MGQILCLHFFTGHILADYYFQTSKIANNKEHFFKYLLLHCFIYLLTMIAVVLPLFSWQLLQWALFIAIIHFVIDSCKAFLSKRFVFTDLQEVLLYFTDQTLHILTILFVLAAIILSATNIAYTDSLTNLIHIFHINPVSLLSWLVILLLLIQPSSITVRTVLDHFNPKTADDGIANAGALIGVFERLLILLMLYANQYAAIGFVLTAKSIARYNKIAEEPAFAEYYLLGTLLSSLLVIVSFHIIF